jgi:hypothetical protein
MMRIKKLPALSIALLIGVGGVGTYSATHGNLSIHSSNAKYLSSNSSYGKSSLKQHRQMVQQSSQQVKQQNAKEWPQQPSSQQQSQQQGQAEGQGTQSTQGLSTELSIPENTQGSGNWAGYIDTPTSDSNSYTSVSGNWKVPNISGDQNGVAAQWIGLGGVSSDDLLQMGTIEQFENGQPVADIFWEKLPSASQNVMSVPIGSTIDAEIAKVSDSTWNITFTVHTPVGQTEVKTIPVTLDSSYAAGVGTSAEWISEDPSDQNDNLYPLANMGAVAYSNAMVDGQALSTSGNDVQPVALVDNDGNILLAPSSLGADGNTFSTDTVSTSSGAGPQSGYGASGRRQRQHRRGEGSRSPYGFSVGYSYQGFGYSWFFGRQ